jgi:hypothetical protein
MPHYMPVNFPAEVTAGGKTFQLIMPKDSVTLGICQRNDGSWFYYATGKDATPGGRRHLSICAGRAMKGGKRENGSIHISLKPKVGVRTRQAFYYFYYADAKSGGAERFVKSPAWGAGGSYEKAEKILNEFLLKFTELATADTKPVVKAIAKAVVSVPSISDEEEERRFEASKSKASVASTPPVGEAVDDWESAL